MTTADQGLGLDLEPEGRPGPVPSLQSQHAQANTGPIHVSIAFAGTLSQGPNPQRAEDPGNI